MTQPTEPTPATVIEAVRRKWELCQSIEVHQPTFAWVHGVGSMTSDYRLNVLHEGMEIGQHQIYTAPTLAQLLEEIERAE